MSGRNTQLEAADDRELERILKMTDAEVLALVGDDEIERARNSLEAVKRRLGL